MLLCAGPPISLLQPSMTLETPRDALNQTYGFQKVRNPAGVIRVCAGLKASQQTGHLLTSFINSAPVSRTHNITTGSILTFSAYLYVA